MNTNLVVKLREQSEIEFRAHSLSLGLSLWAKTNGWAGTHKWMGRFSEEERKHVKGILKVLADYANVKVSIPGVEECDCKANDLPDAYAQILKAVMEAQQGWREIAALSEAVEETDMDDFADHYLGENVTMIKRLNRFMNFFEQVGGNTAAWVHFDKQRK